MLESHTNLLKSSLATLQSELTSLKPLLNTRMPSTSPAPAPNASSATGGSDLKSRYAFAGSSGGTPTLPSWQLAAMNGNKQDGDAKQDLS